MSIALVFLMVLSLPAMSLSFADVDTNQGIVSADDPDEMVKIGEYTGHSDFVHSVHLGDDGYLYSGSADDEVHRIDPETMEFVDAYTGHSDRVTSVHLGDDGYLYSTSWDDEVHRIDPETMGQVDTYTGHSGSVRSVHLGDDGYLYSGSSDDEVHKIDPETMGQVDTYTGHSDTVWSVHLGDDGYLYSGSSNGEVHKIDPETMGQVDTYTGHSNRVQSVKLGDDGYLYSASWDDEVHRIDPETMEFVDAYTGHSNYVYSVDLGDDGYLYSASEDEEVHRIDPETMEFVDAYTGHSEGVRDLYMGDDGYVYSGSNDGEVHRIDSGTEIAETISGQVVDQHGDPVAGATVEAWGVDFDHPDVDGIEQHADELLDDLSDVEPDAWDPTLDPVTDVAETTDEAFYVAAHSPDDWRGFDADVSDPRIHFDEDETIAISVWETDPMWTTTVGSEFTGGLGSDLPGYPEPESTEVEITRLDRDGEASTATVETESTYWGMGFYIAEVDLDPGFYHITSEHNDPGYTIVVGDPDDITGAYAEEIRDESDQILDRAEQIQNAIEDDKLIRVVERADDDGNFEIDVPASFERVAIQSYNAPEDVIEDSIGDIEENLEDYSIDTLHDIYEDGYEGSIYYGEPQRFDVPEDNAIVEVRRLETPPLQDLEDIFELLEQGFDELMEGDLEELEQLLDGVLDEMDIDELEELHQDVQELLEEGDLDEQLDSIYDGDVPDDIDDTIDDLPDDPEDIFDEDLNHDELIEQIEAMEDVIEELEDEIDAIAETPEIDDDQLFYEVEFPIDLDEDDIMVTLTYEDGTTETVPDEDISVTDSGGVFGESTTVTVETEIDEDRALVKPRIDVIDGLERGSASETVVNPGFANDVPELEAIDVSVMRPGVGESVSVEPRPADMATFGELTQANVTAPDGSELDVSIDENRLTFQTEAEGDHSVRLEMENPQGDRFIESFDIRADETPRANPPSVAMYAGITGDFAMAYDNLETARIDHHDHGVDIEVVAPASADTPRELHVYPSADVLRGDEHEISIGIYEGDLEEQVRSHVSVFVHVDTGLDSDTLLWRNDDPITHDGDTRFGEVDHREDKSVVMTYSDERGEIESLRMIEDPSIIQRISHRIDRMMLGIPIVGMTAPVSVLVGSIPMFAIAARREVRA